MCTGACDATDSSQQFAYTCPLANAEYNAWAPSSLILENDGGQGTACGHWDESAFRSGGSSEIMTGFFEANLLQPLSRVTVSAIEDLGGYEVDYCGADIWPATEQSQQRFEVYRTGETMDMSDEGDTMDRVRPIGGISPDGEVMPWGDDGDGDGDSTSAASSWSGGAWNGLVRLVELLAFLAAVAPAL